MVREIPLTRNLVALVDDENYPSLSAHRWYARCASKERGAFYASRWVRVNDKQVGVHMHRVVMNAPDGAVVDHINDNTLDNRKVNLRLCTLAENLRRRRTVSKTGFRGVRRQKLRWRASILVLGRSRHLGSFVDVFDAARAYDAAAREAFGEFARLNFPDEVCPRLDCNETGGANDALSVASPHANQLEGGST